MRKNIFVFMLLSLTFQNAFADVCPDKLLGVDNIQIQQSLSSDGSRCYLGIHPRDAFETLIYRDYLLTSDGFLMVFNSLSPHEGPESAGARDFFFLPTNFTGYEWYVENDLLVVTGFANKTLKFSLSTSQIVYMSGVDLKVSSDVSPNNKGGVEILKSDSLFVDAGWKLGDSPSYDKSGKSAVKNPKNQSCSLNNTQVFDYTEDGAFLKNLVDLRKAVISACSGFDI